MLGDLIERRIERILVLAQDRLLRRPEQLEALFALHAHLGIPTIECVVGGSIDTTTSSGRINARIKAAVDRWYTEYISEKVREQKRHAALAGSPVAGGRRPFGYERGWATLVPHEADLVREAG